MGHWCLPPFVYFISVGTALIWFRELDVFQRQNFMSLFGEKWFIQCPPLLSLQEWKQTIRSYESDDSDKLALNPLRPVSPSLINGLGHRSLWESDKLWMLSLEKCSWPCFVFFFSNMVLGVLRIQAKKGVLHRILGETNYTEIVTKILKSFVV